jgi:multicomponent Na+:H+ antiporter subunit E
MCLAAQRIPWHIQWKSKNLLTFTHNRDFGNLLKTFSLFLVLMAVWLLLSGHYTPLITGFGIASCLMAALIAKRMEVVDKEGHPLHLGPKIVIYWGWLLVEIFKANLDVAKCILFPSRYLRPSMFTSKLTQKSDLGKVIYANSITLTPGTVTVDLDEDTVMVHALTDASAAGVMNGDMDRRVTKVMGET